MHGETVKFIVSCICLLWSYDTSILKMKPVCFSETFFPPTRLYGVITQRYTRLKCTAL